MKEKARADGSFDKLNARLVAGGHQQDRSIYTKEETASPTVGTASVFTCAAIAAHERRGVITMDLATAFLNADMLPEKPVYMKLNPVMSVIFGNAAARSIVITPLRSCAAIAAQVKTEAVPTVGDAVSSFVYMLLSC